MQNSSWITYNEGNSCARKYVEAEHQKVSMILRQEGQEKYTLVIEAGIESISVFLKSKNQESACREADEFAQNYFRDKAKLLEEIADRI